MSEIVGLFGGTFSPPHCGHIHAARSFVRQFLPDVLYVMPCFIPPHKIRRDDATPAQRLEMCRLAFADIPGTVVSDLEIRRGGKSYTRDTLLSLSREGRRILLLCGTDMFLSLEEWYCPADIFRMAEIVLVRREEDSGLADRIGQLTDAYRRKYGAVIHVLEDTPIVISSTEIRARLAQGLPMDGYLTDGVERYIIQCGLYH